MRERLLDLYLRQLPDLCNVWDDELSHPLLISPPVRYAEQKVRLFVAGQEGCWPPHAHGNGPGAPLRGFLSPVASREYVKASSRTYDNFACGARSVANPGGYRKGRFMPALRKLERYFKIEEGQVIWSNLNKCANRKGQPPKGREDSLLEAFDVLAGEVEILRPDVVVFLSGPNYDRFIDHAFKGVQRVALPGYASREVAQLVHPRLPRATFRTYHPAYLARTGDFELALALVAAVARQILEV